MQLFILKYGGYEDMNELMFNIFAVLAFVFCLLGSLFKKTRLVFSVIGAIFLIMATCTGGFIDALHSWLSLFGSVDKEKLNRIFSAGKHIFIMIFILLFAVMIKFYSRRINSKDNNSN
ncbi:hypothetical protein ACO0DA_03380 [Bacillus subtilis]|uniref:hypothetical protein n=1 Tax=Bacillus subtilis TaxID=1423 RepID=UPI00100A0480|nr:hypothetical protein [Bacillus subtilis]MEC0400853.1 hypothetical protein [Bacillus subtilis]QAW06679.1 hypothetical protein ES968_22220 [Bacillus subtilis]